MKPRGGPGPEPQGLMGQMPPSIQPQRPTPHTPWDWGSPGRVTAGGRRGSPLAPMGLCPSQRLLAHGWGSGTGTPPPGDPTLQHCQPPHPPPASGPCSLPRRHNRGKTAASVALGRQLGRRSRAPGAPGLVPQQGPTRTRTSGTGLGGDGGSQQEPCPRWLLCQQHPGFGPGSAPTGARLATVEPPCCPRRSQWGGNANAGGEIPADGLGRGAEEQGGCWRSWHGATAPTFTTRAWRQRPRDTLHRTPVPPAGPSPSTWGELGRGPDTGHPQTGSAKLPRPGQLRLQLPGARRTW